MQFDADQCGAEAQVLLCVEGGETSPAAEVLGDKCDHRDNGCDEALLVLQGLPDSASRAVFGVAPVCLGCNDAPQFAGDDDPWDGQKPFADDEPDDLDGADDDDDDDDDDDFFPDDADDDDDLADDDDEDDDFE